MLFHSIIYVTLIVTYNNIFFISNSNVTFLRKQEYYDEIPKAGDRSLKPGK